MVASPAKRPMPWSAWTTRSPTRKARHFGQHVAAALARDLRTRRSPRMSCSPITASPGASKPVSSGSTATAVAEAGARSVSAKLRDPLRLADAVLGEKRRQPLARAVAPAGDEHALAFALQPLGVGHHRVEDVGPSVWRSAAKVRPCRPPKDTMSAPACSDARRGRARSPGGRRAPSASRPRSGTCSRAAPDR